MGLRSDMASFVGRRLLQEEDDTPTVTFPDDYPNSVRHFLLIGFLGMFIGAIVFFYMGISRKVNTVMHVLTFFVAAVSACAYYAEGRASVSSTRPPTPRPASSSGRTTSTGSSPARSSSRTWRCSRARTHPQSSRSLATWCFT